MQKIYLTQSEVCAEIGVSKFKFVNYIRDNFGAPVKVGKRDYYTPRRIAEYRAKIDAEVRSRAKATETAKRAGFRPVSAKQAAAYRFTRAKRNEIQTNNS